MASDRVDGDTFRWVLGLALGLISTLGGFWMNHLTTQVSEVTKESSARGAKISALEVQAQTLDRRLERIEQKQDAILDRLTNVR